MAKKQTNQKPKKVIRVTKGRSDKTNRREEG